MHECKHPLTSSLLMITCRLLSQPEWMDAFGSLLNDCKLNSNYNLADLISTQNEIFTINQQYVCCEKKKENRHAQDLVPISVIWLLLKEFIRRTVRVTPHITLIFNHSNSVSTLWWLQLSNNKKSKVTNRVNLDQWFPTCGPRPLVGCQGIAGGLWKAVQ